MECGMGIHLLLNLVGCDEYYLHDKENVKGLVLDVVSKSNLSKLKEGFHQFRPTGVTGFVLLEESHFSIHTWPEYNSIAVDLFCCYLNQEQKENALRKAEDAGQLLVYKLNPKEIKKKLVMR
ncbi:MAG: adenosylmethionine decarboxylase [Nanobdellota archaeon]